MTEKCVVRIVGAAVRTPHDGRYLVAWTPHTEYGTLAVTSTRFIRKAKVFDGIAQAMAEWKTTSRAQPRRPDGLPNRPLSALTITFEKVPEREA